jgi:hypothetical protein
VLVVWLVLILAITAVAMLLVWRTRLLRRRDETDTPEGRYRRQIPGLQGGGIHPGSQPSKPPRPNNLSGGGGAY